jgi:hypothetical protein
LLIQHGGIYLDLDTITVASYEPLLDHDMVMGEEENDGKVVGLCNAVMLAARGSIFCKRWLSRYTTFRSAGHDEFWAEHSVRLPLQMSLEAPETITILPPSAFFSPSWSEDQLCILFEEDATFPDAFCHHLWETVSWERLKDLNEQVIARKDTTYNRLARTMLEASPSGVGHSSSRDRQRVTWSL